MPGGHIRLRMLIFPAFRAPSQLIALSWAFTPAIAWVKAHDNRVVKAVTRGVGGRGGSFRLFSGASLQQRRCHIDVAGCGGRALTPEKPYPCRDAPTGRGE